MTSVLFNIQLDIEEQLPDIHAYVGVQRSRRLTKRRRHQTIGREEEGSVRALLETIAAVEIQQLEKLADGI